MSLAKADMGIFETYLGLVSDELRNDFGPLIKEEFARSAQQVTKVTGQALLEGDPTLQRGIDLRNPYGRSNFLFASRTLVPVAASA